MNTKIYLACGLFILQTSCLSHSVDSKVKDEGIKRVLTLYNKSAALYDSNPDSANYYGHQCYELALDLNYPEGQSLGLTNIAYAHYIMGNYPAALDTFHKAIEIDDRYGFMKRKASHYNNIGNIYKSQEDYRRAIQTYDTSFHLAKNNRYDSVLCNASMNLGYVYEKLSQADSALYYESTALTLAQNLPYQKNLNIIYNNLGKIYHLKGNRDLAIAFFNKSITESRSANDIRGRSESYIFLASLYQQNRQYDSSIFFARMGLDTAAMALYPRGELLASEILAKAYKMKLVTRPVVDSSVYYFEKKIEIENKLFNKENLQEVEQLTIAFNKKQEELIAELKRRDDERKHIIQIVMVALGLMILFSILLLIMKKKIKHRAAEIGGLVTVLLLFEFINLLIHPIAESVTNHNFFGMLLILVLPAAILARWHHWFDHWIKNKFSIKKHM